MRQWRLGQGVAGQAAALTVATAMVMARAAAVAVALGCTLYFTLYFTVAVALDIFERSNRDDSRAASAVTPNYTRAHTPPLDQGFTIENGCLTPTFKLKRPQLLKMFQAEVDAMYASLGEDPEA